VESRSSPRFDVSNCRPLYTGHSAEFLLRHGRSLLHTKLSNFVPDVPIKKFLVNAHILLFIA
jgi:hypothetical protein